MWSPDEFPGADNVPWQLLIRARYVDEIDAIVAHTVVSSLAPLMAKQRARNLAATMTKVAAVDGGKRVELAADQRIAALSAFADWDGEICPVGWPWPWPWPPRPRWLRDFDDPAISLALDGVSKLVKGAGSQGLAAAVEEAIGHGGFRG
ncbi:MAG: hypothetical protein ABIS84_00260 [Arachnia sp.]